MGTLATTVDFLGIIFGFAIIEWVASRGVEPLEDFVV
jgi:hypothetical protein